MKNKKTSVVNKNAKLINLATNKAPKKGEKNKEIDIDKLINDLPKTDEEMEHNAKELASNVIKNIPELEDFIEKKENVISLNDEESDSSYLKDEKMGNDWLTEQLTILTEENEILKQRLDMGDNDSVITSERENIISLFMEFQNNLYGRNKERQEWKDVSLSYLIRTFLEMFPYLDQYRLR